MVVVTTPYTVSGLTIFADHADALRFYYFPTTPQLVQRPDGKPVLRLLMYRTDLRSLPQGGEPDDGGVLSLETTLTAMAEQLVTAQRSLQERCRLTEAPRLEPLEVITARARLVLPAGQDVTTMPVSSLEGRAAFTVRLPRVATTLVRELLRSVSSAAGVIYEAEFFGLRPAPNIDFSVDWPQVARHLAEAFAADRLASADEIARAVDELIERAAVRLLIHAGAEAELATQRADARHYTAEFITSAFFVPALSPDSTHGPAYYHQPPPDDRLPALDINAFVGRRRVVAQGTLSQLLGAVAQGAEELIAMVDLGALYRTKDVEVHAFLPDDVEAVEVSLEYGARRVALSLRAQEDRVHVRWPYDPSPGLHYRYRYEVLFKPSAPAWTSNRLLSPTETADTTILVIDPRHLYPPAPAR